MLFYIGQKKKFKYGNRQLLDMRNIIAQYNKKNINNKNNDKLECEHTQKNIYNQQTNKQTKKDFYCQYCILILIIFYCAIHD